MLALLSAGWTRCVAVSSGAAYLADVAHGPGAALGHHAAGDVRELLKVLCQRRGLPAPVYKVLTTRGDVRCAVCACGVYAQWAELMVVAQ